MVVFVVSKSPVVSCQGTTMGLESKTNHRDSTISSSSSSLCRRSLYLQSSFSWGLVGLVLSPFAGSKSDGQRSPNDTVFLRMDEIPYIHEDRPEIFGEDGERVALLSWGSSSKKKQKNCRIVRSAALQSWLFILLIFRKICGCVEKSLLLSFGIVSED